MSKINLSIYLIKEEFESFDDILKEGDILLNRDENQMVFLKESFIKQPDWLSGFFKIDDARLKTSNSRVVYLNKLTVCENVKRIFAITFGYGRTMLQDDVVEENFGLKIVLNTIEKNKLRRISKVDIGKNYKQSQEQLPKESDIFEFGFDENRDLIRYVTGKSDDENFGKSNITGGDLFNLVIDKDIDNIDDFLIYLYNKYTLDDYRNKFDWLDNIKEVRNSFLIDSLNNEIVAILNQKEFDKIWMAIPDYINWNLIRGFKISGQSERTEVYNDIDVQTFIESFDDEMILGYDKIKNKSVYAVSVDDETSKIYAWSANKCLVGCVDYQNKTFAINNGKWYEINKDFADAVNAEYNNLPISEIDVINYTSNIKDETGYNSSLTATFQDYKCLHTIKVPIGGGSGNNIEPCDIFYNNNFIHIKIGGSSSYLSHLFNQAVVSATAFMDVSFREKYNQKLAEKNFNDIIIDNFYPSNYSIVLGIINKKPSNELPHIPFFSKVSIKYAKKNIENLGYKFLVKSIPKTQ